MQNKYTIITIIYTVLMAGLFITYTHYTNLEIQGITEDMMNIVNLCEIKNK